MLQCRFIFMRNCLNVQPIVERDLTEIKEKSCFPSMSNPRAYDDMQLHNMQNIVTSLHVRVSVCVYMLPNNVP